MASIGKGFGVLSLLAALAALATGAAEGPAETSSRPEILAVVRTLLDGWREADPGKVASALHPDARFVTLRDGDAVHVETRAHLLETVGRIQPGAWDARLRDEEIRVNTAGIATVWAKYTLYSDGRRSHCGIEIFQLYQLAAGWKIVHFADTPNVGGCAPEEAQGRARRRSLAGWEW